MRSLISPKQCAAIGFLGFFVAGCSAVARVVPTDQWERFEDPTFAFSYPPDLLVSGDIYEPLTQRLLTRIEEIDTLPQGHSENSAEHLHMQNPEDMVNQQARSISIRDATARGELGPALNGYVVPGSEKPVKIGGLRGKTFIEGTDYIISLPDDCNIRFQRTALLFNGNQRILISLVADREEIIREMPEYFTTDPDTCGSFYTMWNADKQKEFLSLLESGQAAPYTQNWYDTFDAMVRTVRGS